MEVIATTGACVHKIKPAATFSRVVCSCGTLLRSELWGSSEAIAAYEAQAGKITVAQFELAISRMVALSDNAHSEDHPYLFRGHHNTLPCLPYHFSDGYYIIRARPSCQPLLGAKLVAIDGHAIDEIADRLFDYVRGPRNHFDDSKGRPKH